MAVEALSILLDPKGKALLAELDKGVIENIQTGTISSLLKNRDLSGTMEKYATLKARRFANAKSQKYGTARAAGKGNALKELLVDVNVDQDREFVEEVEQKDVSLGGVADLLSRRSNNQKMRLVAELDSEFFAEAAKAGTEYEPAASITEPWRQVENAIVTLSTLKTDYVDGVPRNLMTVVCSAEFYSSIREHLDSISNSGITIADSEFGKFHGVPVYSSINLPEGVEFILITKDSVAQPLHVNPYQARTLELSDAIAIPLFFYYGTKAVTPELILVKKSSASSDESNDGENNGGDGEGSSNTPGSGE